MLQLLKHSRWILPFLAIFFAGDVFAHGMSEEEKSIIIEGGNLRYILIGATHMLSGYDHLLFIFGIIFFLTRFKDIIKYISAFTIGHSITLIWATFNTVQVDYFLIDAVIGLSVCYIAFQNLDGFKRYLNVRQPNMLAMILGLGLIHGLGLSTRLQQLPLSEDQLLMNIISFNIGIEVGQVVALAAMLVFMSAFRKRKSFSVVSKICNASLILAGGLLFMMQMHGYEHVAKAEEFAGGPKISAREERKDFSSFAGARDTISIQIPARGDKEYKLQLKAGESFQYAWKADNGELFFDFHGEPAGDTTGNFTSFNQSTDREYAGSLTATFAGTHGWYWKNTTSSPVTITLMLKGEYERLDEAPADDSVKIAQEEQIKNHDSL